MDLNLKEVGGNGNRMEGMTGYFWISEDSGVSVTIRKFAVYGERDLEREIPQEE